MKLFIVLAAVALAQAAKLDRVYLPPNAQASSGSDNFLQTPLQSNNGFQAQNNNDYPEAPAFNGNAYAQNANVQNANVFSSAPNSNYAQNAYSEYDARPERPQAAFERNAAILRQDNSNDGETYSFAYETENGIYAEENGVATNGVQAQGGYSYTGDDGKVYSVRYTADENGFVPQGDHLPTPPPIPEEILKALEQNARDEAAGIYDDGSYSEGKYAAEGDNQQQYYNTNAQPINYQEDSVVTNPAALRNTAAFNGAIRNNQQQNYNSNAQPINYDEDSVVTNAAVRDNAGFNGVIGNNQQQYFNNNAQPNNYADNSVVTNAAAFRNGVANSVDKTYLPPFAQSNNQRNGNFNARNGYRY